MKIELKNKTIKKNWTLLNHVCNLFLYNFITIKIKFITILIIYIPKNIVKNFTKSFIISKNQKKLKQQKPTETQKTLPTISSNRNDK